MFNAQTFNYISFSCLSNVYINPELNIINPSSEVIELGVHMFSNNFFMSQIYIKDSQT